MFFFRYRFVLVLGFLNIIKLIFTFYGCGFGKFQRKCGFNNEIITSIDWNRSRKKRKIRFGQWVLHFICLITAIFFCRQTRPPLFTQQFIIINTEHNWMMDNVWCHLILFVSLRSGQSEIISPIFFENLAHINCIFITFYRISAEIWIK